MQTMAVGDRPPFTLTLNASMLCSGSAVSGAVTSAPSPSQVTPVDTSRKDVVDFWSKHNPAVLSMAQGSSADVASAYVCQNMTCLAPTSDPGKLRAIMARPAQGATKVAAAQLPARWS